MSEKSLHGTETVFEMRIEDALITCHRDKNGKIILAGYGWTELYDYDSLKGSVIE